ncbi:CRE-SPE-27 protein [Caenorhabditis remanei]|uniref:CRE-SPE-27 protein n=1 Tax=Caenorhabditis remanei TaxID=31234 RepID=E3NR95_CAERE|nr:CRE-SPE-27 protein [Caenorhabditis remanei]
MNKLLICAVFVSFTYYCHSAILDELFDINDVENKACKDGCETENVRKSSVRSTYDKLYKCYDSECSKLFELCIKVLFSEKVKYSHYIQYRTCQDNCVPEMAVLPYKQAKEMAERVRPPINPCMDLVSACNYETMDSYEILRTENPFLYI